MSRMRVPLIFTRTPNEKESNLWPATGPDAMPVLTKEDGKDILRFSVDKVESQDIKDGKAHVPFSMDEPEQRTWEVLLTDRRIIVSNRWTEGFFGKTSRKPDRAVCGHLYYRNLVYLSALEPKNPVFLCSCMRSDRMRTAFVMSDHDIANLRALAAATHGRVHQWLERSGTLLKKGQSSDYTHLMKRWQRFPDGLWENQQEKERTVLVPMPLFTPVACGKKIFKDKDEKK